MAGHSIPVWSSCEMSTSSMTSLLVMSAVDLPAHSFGTPISSAPSRTQKSTSLKQCRPDDQRQLIPLYSYLCQLLPQLFLLGSARTSVVQC